MKCRYCGQKVKRTDRFCFSCGKQIQAEAVPGALSGAPVEKDTSTRVLIGILIGVCTLVVILGVFLVLLLSHPFQKREKVEVSTQEVIEEQIQEHVEMEATENIPPQIAREPAELLDTFYTETLVEKYGQLDPKQIYEGQYVTDASNENFYMADVEYPDALSGVIKKEILDLDGDTEPEMLVFVCNKQEIWVEYYDCQDGEVVLLQTESMMLEQMGGCDLSLADYYLKKNENGSGYYFVENGYDAAYLFADGVYEYMRVLDFTPDGMVEGFYETLCGSEFSDMQEEIYEKAEQLRQFGLNVTADTLDTKLSILPGTDGLELVLHMQKCNSEYYKENNTLYEFSETGDASLLGTMRIQFYLDEASFAKQNAITDYSTEIHDYRNADSVREVEAFYEVVHFDGKNEELRTWLNRVVNSEEADYAARAKEEAWDDGLMYPEEVYSWMPTKVDSVYYDNRFVSVGRSWSWYMGGVSNGGWQCVNLDLHRRCRLSLPEVLGKSADEVDRMVLDALVEQWEIEREYVEEEIAERDGYYTFYFDKDTVYVCFESYELNLGGGWMSIELPR